MQFRLQTLLAAMGASAVLFWMAFAADYWIALPLLALGAAPQVAIIAVLLTTSDGNRRAFALGAASVAWLPLLIVMCSIAPLGYCVGMLSFWQDSNGQTVYWEDLYLQLQAPLDQEMALYEVICRTLLVGNYLLAVGAGLLAVVFARVLTPRDNKPAPRRPRLLAALLLGAYLAVPVATCALTILMGDVYGMAFLWGACLLTYPLAAALVVYGQGVWRAVGIGVGVAACMTLAGNLLMVIVFPIWVDALFGFDADEAWAGIITGIFAAKWLAVGISVLGALVAWRLTRSPTARGPEPLQEEPEPAQPPPLT